MKISQDIYLWLNISLLLIYVVIAIFIDGNDSLFLMGECLSKTVIYTIFFCGVGVAVWTTVKQPRRWFIPAFCIMIYLSLVL